MCDGCTPSGPPGWDKVYDTHASLVVASCKAKFGKWVAPASVHGACHACISGTREAQEPVEPATMRWAHPACTPCSRKLQGRKHGNKCRSRALTCVHHVYLGGVGSTRRRGLCVACKTCSRDNKRCSEKEGESLQQIARGSVERAQDLSHAAPMSMRSGERLQPWTRHGMQDVCQR